MMSLKRWYYRGGHPNRVARALDRCTAALYALGVAPNYLVVLEVPGRRSDRTIALPLVMVVVGGERYLVSMLGEKANWVSNVRAAGGEVTLRHGRREEVCLEEVTANLRAPLLKAYLKRAPNARAHLPVDKDAPLAEFERVAHRFPVFRVAGSTMFCGILSPSDSEGSLRENEVCSRSDQRGERTSAVHNPMPGATSWRRRTTTAPTSLTSDDTALGGYAAQSTTGRRADDR